MNNSRRKWIKTASMGLGISMLPKIRMPKSEESSNRWDDSKPLRPFFGDIHNHNAMGYAKGSLKRSFEIARNQKLDFYALTPHAHWHDIEKYEGGIEDKWLKGFEATKAMWPDLLKTVKEFNKPGDFITFPAFEWHSSYIGDYHVVFPSEEATLYLPDTIKKLQDFVRSSGAIMVPHHIANTQGRRGANFALRDPKLSPLVEVYSEWGNAVSDKGPYPYIRHSPGGRWTKNTMQYRLDQGDRFGVIASSDDHLGKPGAYPQGLAVVLATDLTREAIFDAFWNRRTYAVTGDRIRLNFRLNGLNMGEEMEFVEKRKIHVNVTGWDQIEAVEIYKNNRIIHRNFPQDNVPTRESWANPVLLWFEYGWGPWADLQMDSVTDWKVFFEIKNGKLEELQPAFTAGPFDEERRDQILDQNEHGFRLESFTARRQQFEDRAQKGIALKVRGNKDTSIKITMSKPCEKSWTFSMEEMIQSNKVFLTGKFPSESALLHRPVFHENYHTEFGFEDKDDGSTDTWYYVRVRQANQQYAWSSPIWINSI